MGAFIRIEGGPHLGIFPVESHPPKVIALGVSEQLERDDGPNPCAFAMYELIQQGEELVYAFRSYMRPNRQPFMVEFVGGPRQGIHPMPQPAVTFGPFVRCPLKPDGTVHEWIGPVGGVAVYERASDVGPGKYFFQSVDTSAEAIAAVTEAVMEQCIDEAIHHFYSHPKSQADPTQSAEGRKQVLVEVGHRRARVDAGIAEVIRELFRLGLDTRSSSQEIPSPEKFAGQAYVAFHRARDAKRFYELLRGANIEATLEETTISISARRSADSPREDQVEIPSGKVMFAASQIDETARLLRASV
jgi:hypothetical protein